MLPAFLPKITPRVFSSGSATFSPRGPPARTSMTCGRSSLTLVPRTRSSPRMGPKYGCELRVQRGTRIIIESLMSLRFRSSYKMLRILTNFGIGTLVRARRKKAPIRLSGKFDSKRQDFQPMRQSVRIVRLAFFLAALAAPAIAQADFRLCNRTQSRVGVAVGYKDNDVWTTEGWWNVAANSCETLMRGPLVARFYYIYALDYDQGGEWAGQALMCTREKEFTIKGIGDCLARGFDRTGFFEIDTGEQKNWTVQLTEQGQTAPVSPQSRQGSQGR